ncbi:unnamed protein product [Owenia fusiformis]|uniref:CWH43-like N-terminal domain-containing protein n=1 Tax=Owenia fusiformis TaxID=6347 RepID=A0A8J1TI87_OWEFU|nr:unnamed protein product [Owenia fusiformis]
MGNERTKKVDNILATVPFPWYAVVTVSLPFFSIIICLLIGLIFQYEAVCRTDTCKHITNFIPSISAVTGALPQKYIWRTCISLHTPPRFLVAVMYYNYYKSYMNNINQSYRGLYTLLIKASFWINIIENFSLFGTSVVLNIDNYPVHEKIFICFMVTSMVYMFLSLVAYAWSRPKQWAPEHVKSFRLKLLMFVLISMATSGLIFFFLLHKWYCAQDAFSYFSLCEYVIAFTNIGFHFTAYIDLNEAGGMYLIAGRSMPVEGSTNNVKNGTKIRAKAD